MGTPMRFLRSTAFLRALACVSVLAGAVLGSGVSDVAAQPKPAGAGAKGAPAASGAPSSSAAPAPSAAPIGPEDDEMKVQRFYAEGDEALKKLDFKAAEAAFTKAWIMSRTFDVAAKLGETKLELGMHQAAAMYLSFALRNAAPSMRPNQRERLRAGLEAARKQIVTVKFTTNLAEAEVWLDGVPLAPLFVAPEIFLDPGPHTFEGKAEGYTSPSAKVNGKAGETVTVTLTLERESKPRNAPPPAATATASTPLPAALMGGVGAVGVVLGAVFVGVAEARKGDAYSLSRNTLTADGRPTCPKQGPGPTDACDQVRAAAADVDTFGNAGLGALIAGGALLAGATGYVFLFGGPSTPAGSPPPASSGASSPKKPPALTGRVVPVAGPGGAGLLLTGSF